jgi:flagellar basal-body rod modification protein FlgD
MTSVASMMPATAVALPTGTQLPTGATGLSSNGQMLGQNQFLQLLTAQLENQDPLDPTNADAFASELAEFTTATGVQGLETSATGQQAVGLVGQNVAVNGDSLTLATSGPATGAFNLSAAASDVTAVITNAAGNAIASVDLGAMPAGAQSFSWNGTGTNGVPAPPGNYTFSIAAIGSNGAAVPATTYAVAPVTGVGLGGQSVPMIELGGGLGSVPLSSVQQVL